jgi:pyrimidine deaminase RibD-like protein
MVEKHVQGTTAQLFGDREDLECMKMAIEAARNCNSANPADPKVGAVAKLPDGTIISAFRGEIVASFDGEQGSGDHAEYTLLQKKLPETSLAGAKIYVTLEPCSTGRTPPKVPCVDWLIDRQVGMVWMGMLDPDHRIQGDGQNILAESGIPTQLFPHNLSKEIRDLNQIFINDRREKRYRREQGLEFVEDYLREAKDSGVISEEGIQKDTWESLLKKTATKDGTAAPGINVEPQHQLNRPALDAALDNLDEDDRDVRRRLLGYSRWYDPANKAEIFEKLAGFGHEQDIVENNARRLHDADLIRITANYYLPLNEEICQQAAESLMPELLAELEE